MEGKVGVVVRSNAEAAPTPAAAVKMQALGSGKGELGDDDDDGRLKSHEHVICSTTEMAVRSV